MRSNETVICQSLRRRVAGAARRAPGLTILCVRSGLLFRTQLCFRIDGRLSQDCNLDFGPQIVAIGTTRFAILCHKRKTPAGSRLGSVSRSALESLDAFNFAGLPRSKQPQDCARVVLEAAPKKPSHKRIQSPFLVSHSTLDHLLSAVERLCPAIKFSDRTCVTKHESCLTKDECWADDIKI